MGRYLDLAKQVTPKESRDDSLKYDGHRVAQVEEESGKMVIFRDEAGNLWRYLHAYAKAWPMIDVSQGKALISEAWRQIDALFTQFADRPGMTDRVCDWIKDAGYGEATRKAQDALDEIGSGGDPAKLKAACREWVESWKRAVDKWEKANGNG